MKHILKEVIPPVVYRRLLGKPAGKSYKIFPTYEEALTLCTTGAYEENELIEVVFKKTKRFSERLQSSTLPVVDTNAFSLLAMMNPIVENRDITINVLDFGGACGAHYFQFRRVLDRGLQLNWAVVETPMMVKYAKPLATAELSFFDSFAEAVNKLGQVDLLHTSGTLQCVDDPQKYLDYILASNARWVVFNRLGLNQVDRDVITIHSSMLSWNGIGELPDGHTDRWVKYPFTFISEAKFLDKIQEKYAITCRFNDNSGMYAIKGEQITGYGLLCKNKAIH